MPIKMNRITGRLARFFDLSIGRIKNPALRKTAWFAVLWCGSVLFVGSFAYILRALLKMTF